MAIERRASRRLAVALGVAIHRSPAFGKGFGGLSLVLGVVGLVAAAFNMANPSPIGAFSLLAIVIFFLALGWKVHSPLRAS